MLGGTNPARFRRVLDQARAEASRAIATNAGGIAAAAHLADAADTMVCDLWRTARGQVPGADTAKLALVATGGWGRRELCPYSDIDFIILAPKRSMAVAQKLADAILYPLWDAAVDLGHAVRDPDAAGALARDDLATATALIDARLVAGDGELATDLFHATRRAIAPGGSANDLVAKLGADMGRRHERFGASIYLLEPNLKHGIGGLRDVATAVWAARARFAAPDLDALVAMGVVSPRQVSILTEGLDFLLKLRILARLSARRATDQLTFEIQEAIAPWLYPNAKLPDGDIRPAVAPAVEALMRRYYLFARDIAKVAGRILEAAVVARRRRPRIARIDATFLTFNGKLSVSDPQIFRDRPEEMVRLFLVALEHGVPIYGHTKELVTDIVNQPSTSLVNDPKTAALFCRLLCDARDCGQPSLLEDLHEVGLLCAIIPELSPCTGRVQHDLYHVYTVDQHQLYAVAMLKRLALGQLATEHPEATAALAEVTRPLPLYLATLVHDIGKPLGKGHAQSGARLAHTIARRLGMSAEDADTAAFLVLSHLTMAHISQRRDLSDPDVIRRFADRVGSRERLAMLYVLTCCDTAMTAPGNLSAWKAALLASLYERTRAVFAGGAGGDGDVAFAAARTRARAAEILAGSGDGSAALRDRAEAFFAGVDERFFTSLTPRQIARAVRMAWTRADSGNAIELAVACYPLKGHSEVTIAAGDAPRLLATVAGVLAANRVDVLGAVISTPATMTPAVALDLFYVRDPAGKAIPTDDPRWDKVRADLAALLAGGAPDPGAVRPLIERRRPPSPLGPKKTPAITTEIRLIHDGSAEHTIIEVHTRDQVGVLFAITSTLAAIGLDIHRAMVSTEGEKVADVFYVSRDGEKLDRSQEAEVISALSAATGAASV